MSCNRLEASLMEYLDGRLPAGERAVVDKHLASCEECAARVEGFRAVSRSLDAWEAPEVSPWFDARLRGRMAEEAARSWSLPSLRALLRPVYALGLAAMVLVGSLVVWNTRPSPPVQKAENAKPAAAAEAERLDEIMPVVEDYDILANFDMLAELKPAPGRNKL